MSSTTLKYTPKEISTLVQKEIKNIAEKDKISINEAIEQLSKSLSLNVNNIKLFYEDFMIFTFEQYDYAAKILNKTVDELTEIIEINNEKISSIIKFREQDTPEDILQKEINSAISLFTDIVNFIRS